MIFGNSDIGKGQRMGVGGVPAELGIARTDHEARRANRHDNRRDLRLAIVASTGTGRDDADRSDISAGISDELLATVDQPFMITQRGARPGSTGVRASFRFGESKSREGPAG